MGKGDYNRWLEEEIEWGKELADERGVGYGDEDWWSQYDEEERDAPTMAEQKADALWERLNRTKAPEMAEPAEVVALGVAKQAVKVCLNVHPITDTDVDNAEQAWRLVEGELRAIDFAIRERKDDHDKVRLAFGAVDEDGHLKDHKTKIAAAKDKVQKALDLKITTASIAAARKALQELEELIETCAEELEALGGEDGVSQICNAFGIDEDDFNDLEAALGGRAEVLKALKVFSPQDFAQVSKAFGAGQAGAAKLGPVMTAMGGPAKMKTTMGQLGGEEKLAALMDKGHLDGAGIQKICDDLGPGFLGELMGDGDDPDAAIALQTEMGGEIEKLQDLVKDAGFDGKPKTLVALLKDGCGGDPAAFKGFCLAFDDDDAKENLKGIVDQGGLGDAPDALASLLATGCNGNPEQLKAMAAAFDDDDKRDGLNRMLNDAGLTGDKDGDVDPAIMGHLLAGVSGDKPDGMTDDDFAKKRAADLANLCENMDAGACATLKTTLEDTGLGNEPAVFAQIVGVSCDQGDAALLRDFNDELAKDPANKTALKNLLGDGGLGATDGADPACLAYMLKTGCENKPDKLVTLMKGMDDDARKDLKEVLTTGGLGQDPEVLGALIGKGCENGDPVKLNDLTKELSDDPGTLDSLKKALDDGGLGTKDGTDPECLAFLLKHGCEGKPDELVKLLNALGDDDRANLKKCMTDGGLGDDPEVFGHLIGTGCDEGDAAKFKALMKELADKPENLKALDDMIKKGGLGTKDDTGAATNVDPKCLGKLLDPGCNGDPEELVKMLTAFDDPSRAALKGVMSDGELGKHPEVFGNLYQQGCLDDPVAGGVNPHLGTKNPEVLKDMVNAFDDATGPELFKNMLNDSGFTEAGNENRLASVMKHAFTPPPHKPNPGKQDGSKLRDLADSFDGNFDQMKEMMEAFEGSPAYMVEQSGPNDPKQPGKSMANVLFGERFDGDPSDMQAEFFQTLEDHFVAGPTPTEAGWVGSPARMTKTMLLQTAGSFEQLPLGPAVVQCDNGGGLTYDVDMHHIVRRHTRKEGRFDLNASPHKGTTLYDNTVGTAEVTTIINQSLANGPVRGPGAGLNRTDGSGNPKRIPPQDEHDLNNGNPSRMLPTDGDDGHGNTSRIGFKKTGGGPITIGQVYPLTATGGLQNVNTNDFIAMRNALMNTAGGFY